MGGVSGGGGQVAGQVNTGQSKPAPKQAPKHQPDPLIPHEIALHIVI